MSGSTAHPQHRASLRGLTKWLFVLAMPCSALAFDTWLNTELIRKDYRIAELSKWQKELTEQFDPLRIEEAYLDTQLRGELEGPNLGLVEPQPEQIEMMYYAEAEAPPAVGAFSFSMARVEVQDPGNAGGAGRPWVSAFRASLPMDTVAKGGEAARSGEDKSWTTHLYSSPITPIPMGDLLKWAINAASASSRAAS